MSSQGVNRRLLTRDVKAAHPVGKVGSERVQVYSQDGKLYAQLSSNDAVLIADLSVGSVPVGSVSAYAGNDTEPAGYFLCNGDEKSQTDYAALYAVIGDDYGDATTSGYFKLPDLAGKVIASVDGSNALASAAGAESVSLVAANLPNHTHTTGGTQSVSVTHTMESGVEKIFTTPSPTTGTWADGVDDANILDYPMGTNVNANNIDAHTRSAEDSFAFTADVAFSNATVTGGGSATPTGVNVKQPTLYMKYIIKY